MNYDKLFFFDIEASDGLHICSFGYLETTLSFDIISRGRIDINPHARFEKRLRDYNIKKEDYKECGDFTKHYDQIAAFLRRPGVLAAGHAVDSDVRMLERACARYNLPEICYSFIDSQTLYNAYKSRRDSEFGGVQSLGKIMEELDLPFTEHDPQEDARASMETLKFLCAAEGMDMAALLEHYRAEPGALCVVGGEIYLKNMTTPYFRRCVPQQTKIFGEKKTFEGILFDMDGVLLDSEQVITKAAILGLQEFGVSAQAEDFKAFTGMGEDRFIGGVAKKYGVKYHAGMKKRVYDIYDTIVAEEIKTFPNTVEHLTTLKEKGYKMAVCSSADLRKVKINLKSAGIDLGLFDAVLTAEDVVRKKPNPEIFIKGAKALGLPNDRCAVVEDAVSGADAGSAAGSPVIGVTTSFSESDLRRHNCYAVIRDISKILEVL